MSSFQVKIDTEKYPVLASEYKVEALPTFIIFYKGKPVDRVVSPKASGRLPIPLRTVQVFRSGQHAFPPLDCA